MGAGVDCSEPDEHVTIDARMKWGWRRVRAVKPLHHLQQLPNLREGVVSHHAKKEAREVKPIPCQKEAASIIYLWT
jgi:hypothetical protein